MAGCLHVRHMTVLGHVLSADAEVDACLCNVERAVWSACWRVVGGARASEMGRAGRLGQIMSARFCYECPIGRPHTQCDAVSRPSSVACWLRRCGWSASLRRNWGPLVRVANRCGESLQSCDVLHARMAGNCAAHVARRPAGQWVRRLLYSGHGAQLRERRAAAPPHGPAGSRFASGGLMSPAVGRCLARGLH